MTKARVLPVTPDGKKYERRSYSDGERRRAGAEERERPTTSGYGTSLRERHTGFSPVRHQVRPSTAGPTSNRENLAVYLERMERILAEVQATHTDLVSRRNNRRGSRLGSNRSSPAKHEAPPPHQVATVPLLCVSTSTKPGTFLNILKTLKAYMGSRLCLQQMAPVI